MKNAISVGVIITAFWATFNINRFLTYKETNTPVTSERKDSTQFFSFKKELEPVDGFIRMMSNGEQSLDDTLQINSPGKRTIKIWARHFWGSKRPSVYEIGISSEEWNVNKIILPEQKEGEKLSLLYERDSSPDPRDSDYFFYFFKGLLRTYCMQHGYEPPSF